MSTRQTKGKQKIEMKKVETYGDRMITFSKRKAGIFKKMNEIMSVCDIEATFLVFSHAGKPYSLAKPSMEKMADMLKSSSKHEPSEKTDNNHNEALLEAYKKQMIEDLTIRYLESIEQLGMENEKLNMLMETRYENELNKMWWNIPSEGSLSVEESKQKHKTYCELHDNLCDLAFLTSRKYDHGSSSGRMGREA